MPDAGIDEKRSTVINISMRKKKWGRKQERKRCFKNNQAKQFLRD